MALKLIPYYSILRSFTFSNDKKPTQNHVLVYGAIEAHGMGEKGCIASNRLIGEELDISEGTVANIISDLAREKWITVYLTKTNRRTLIQANMMVIIAHEHESDQAFRKQKSASLRNEAASSENEATLHRTMNIDNNIEHSKENNTSKLRSDDPGSLQASSSAGVGNKPVMDSAARAAHLRKVFDVLATTLHPGQKILYTETRKNKLRKRLESFKPSELVKAAKNLTLSDFHMGNNDQKTKYATYDFLIKNDEKVEKWLNAKPVNKPKSVF